MEFKRRSAKYTWALCAAVSLMLISGIAASQESSGESEESSPLIPSAPAKPLKIQGRSGHSGYRPLLPTGHMGPSKGWSPWSQCAYGFQTKYQHGCDQSLGMPACVQRKRCGQVDPRPLSPWSTWSQCVDGMRIRKRHCFHGDSQGSCVQTITCDLAPWASWSSWTSWKNNPSSWQQWNSWSSPPQQSPWGEWSGCANGVRLRRRQRCQTYRGGDSRRCVQREQCYKPSTWQTWSSWSTTQQSPWGRWSECNYGIRTRRRRCGSKRSQDCVKSEKCHEVKPTPYPWKPWSNWKTQQTPWGAWSACSYGIRTRKRQCEHTDQYSQNKCVQSEVCDKVVPTPSPWQSWSSWQTTPSLWGQWSACSYGVRTRRRHCSNSNTYPQQKCVQSEKCDSVTPSAWGRWSACQYGVKTRRRRCGTKEDPKSCVQSTRCRDPNPNPNPRPNPRPNPTSWGSWSSCQKGVQERSRRCVDQWGKLSTCTQTRSCSSGWGGGGRWLDWGAWTKCHEGVSVRTRTCAGTVPCKGYSYESKRCQDYGQGQKTLPWQTGQKRWSPWSPCEHQRQIRVQPCWTTNCRSMDVENRDCTGTFLRSRKAKISDKVSNSGWGPWSTWSACAQGFSKRSRQCISGQCEEHSTETVPCLLQYDPKTGSIIDDRND